jgi:hypothetical protein
MAYAGSPYFSYVLWENLASAWYTANKVTVNNGVTANSISQYNTTNGLKVGLTTAEKVGFFGVTPVVQPANSVAIDTLLTNFGLRASGGTSNFSTVVDVSAVAAGSPSFRVTATTDTPSTTWTAGVPSTNPAGFIEILVGANTRYIPFWS